MSPTMVGYGEILDERTELLDMTALLNLYGLNGTCNEVGATRRGFGFMVYETIKAYCAVALEIAVNSAGQIRLVRAVAAIDSGNAGSPHGIEN
jgi:nicotinate dehydrogenase subunit B